MKKLVFLSVASLSVASALAWIHFAGSELDINGKHVSTEFMTKGGKTFVPLADVAKALNMVVTKTADGYSLAPSGGANQVDGLNGKVGDQLNCGAFLLTLTSAEETYDYSYQNSDRHEKPYKDSDKLVVLKFHVKNATKLKQSLDTLGGDLTALTDKSDHNFTSRTEDGERGPDMLPGSAVDFALIYYVPKDMQPGDMVYQLHSYTLQKGYKDYTFRISLAK